MTEPQEGHVPPGWEDEAHTELEGPSIGEGFVAFDALGAFVRGIVRHRFTTKHGDALALELTAPPGAPVFRTAEDGSKVRLDVKPGDVVNLSLSALDLAAKLARVAIGDQIGVVWVDSRPTPSGRMKLYKVMAFQDELPF